MSELNQTKNPFYFSTRDLLLMAVFAALGGVASTYINTLGDAVHAALGLPGATQWAAGLHVLWLVLGMGIIRKPGAGTFIGILKGAVELMSGNTHGVIILLVDLVAGLLVDFGFLLFHKNRTVLPYLVAGGLATASNVLVFQIFATLPMNILGITAILILMVVALISGLIFAGIIPYLLVNRLAKAGIVKTPSPSTHERKVGWWIILGVFLLAVLLAIFLHMNLRGPVSIQISGAVNRQYEFPFEDFQPKMVTKQMEYRGVMTEYTGYQLKELIQYAEPDPNANTLLIEASDGYAFLISFDELESNPDILLVTQGRGEDASFDIVGPESSKAWVRNVTKMTVIPTEGLTIIQPSGEQSLFDPDEWLAQMDSTQIALPQGSQKLQGVPVWKIIKENIDDEIPEEVIFKSNEKDLSLPWAEIQGNDELRIFIVIESESISFALAEMSGEAQLYPVKEMEIN